MRVSELEVVQRVDALFGAGKSIVKRPIGPVLMVCKYLGDRDMLGMLTSRAISKMH